MMVATATGFSEILQAISDVGAMIVLSAAAIFALIRVLSVMVDQVKTTYESVVPSIQTVRDECREIKTSLIQSLTNHNTASQKQLYELKVDVQTAIKHLDRIAEKVDKLEDDINKIAEKKELTKKQPTEQ